MQKPFLSARFPLTFSLLRITASLIVLCLPPGIFWRTFLCTWRWNTWPFKIFNRFFALFLKSEFHEEFASCTHMDCTKYFSACRGRQRKLLNFKQNLIQIVCFVRYPTSLVFAIIQHTQNKHTYWIHQLHKNTTLFTVTRTTVVHNYQPQVQIHYIFSSVLANSIETFGSLLSNFSFCYITFILFEWSEKPII